MATGGASCGDSPRGATGGEPQPADMGEADAAQDAGADGRANKRRRVEGSPSVAEAAAPPTHTAAPVAAAPEQAPPDAQARARPHRLRVARTAQRPRARNPNMSALLPLQAPRLADDGPIVDHPPGHPLSLPEGWMQCPPIGELCFNLFVPCKVPLGRRFNEVLHEHQRFTPAHALAEAAAAPPGCERQVLAVVDLTKTKRYYSPDELRDAGVHYIKVPCSGSEGAPSPLEVNTFFIEVVSVLARWRPRQGTAVQPVILVHCTHGFNRTGAMLVHYAMRQPQRWPDLTAALAEFARCRSGGIYKEDYIACARERTRAPTCAGPGAHARG
jgi:hypothetical protein